MAIYILGKIAEDMNLDYLLNKSLYWKQMWKETDMYLTNYHSKETQLYNRCIMNYNVGKYFKKIYIYINRI